MRVFGILLSFVFAIHFAPIEAHNQQEQSFMQNKEEKIYVSAENFYLGKEGIFWQVSEGNWIPINGIECDSNGIYLAGSRVSSSPKRWRCPYCNHWWQMGEKCQNEDCPTNQWKKEGKE